VARFRLRVVHDRRNWRDDRVSRLIGIGFWVLGLG
jgi:hypothetical protein